MTKQQPWADEPVRGPMLRPREASSYLGLSISTYYEMISQGDLPPLIKVSPRGRATAHPKCWLDMILQQWASKSIGGQQ